jgi:Kef-type K+ transport system membrane component KefB
MFPQYLQLLFLGVSILLALIFSRGATLLKSPLIVGYIVAGAILGPEILHFINDEQIASLDIVNLIVLSLLGFGIGGELRFSELKKLGKGIIIIVIFEALGAFLLVGLATFFLLKSIPMGLILGSIASATAPAGTVDVIKQYKAKGNFTTTLYAIMGLDDILALLLFTISLPIAMIFLGGTEQVSISNALLHAGKEVLFSASAGIAIGFLVTFIAKGIYDRVSLLLFSLGIVLVNCGIADWLHLSPILMNMAMGIVLVNRSSHLSRKIFTVLGDWTPPMYVWFFVLIGTRLNIHLIIQYGALVGFYILARSFGKWGGTFIGGSIAKSPKLIRNYLGMALLSQAGVAVGLALAASKTLENNGLHESALLVMGVTTATTFLIMLIGPIMAKIALFKSGETNMDK